MKHILLSLFVLSVSFVASAQDDAKYPRSEWDYAKAILMHTPGEELFDGKGVRILNARICGDVAKTLV